MTPESEVSRIDLQIECTQYTNAILVRPLVSLLFSDLVFSSWYTLAVINLITQVVMRKLQF